MKNVGVVYNSLYAEHDTGNHPECGDRLTTTIEYLKKNQIYGDNRKSYFKDIKSRAATVDEIKWGHSQALIDRVISTVNGTKKKGGRSYLDGDTVVSPVSYDATLHSTGGNFASIDAIFNGEIDRGFVLCRPPGHHSNENNCRGFCIFNNVILAAEYLFRKKGLNRVAIVDFDVHAGNGSEDMIENGMGKGELLFISSHQHPRTLYPGTCFIEDIGEGKQKGKTVNITYSPGSGQKSVELAFNEIISPLLNEFKPEFILVSAGFDAHHDDPLGSLTFTDQTYSYMIKEMAQISEKHANGRMQCTLEGGYDLDAIARSMTNVISTLADDKSIYVEEEYSEDEKSIEFTEEHLIPEVKKTLAPYWKCF
jgi:acetoin utilization deacetylase AcuC-like enzyme